MTVVLRTPPPHTPLQRFRALTEDFLMMVAQEEMVRKHPDAGIRPYAPQGWIYPALRLVFLPGFRLVPWPMRQLILRMFFVRRPQRWRNW